MTIDATDQVFRGKNVEAAVEAGLATLGLRRDQVEIEVVHPGSRGLLGIGAEDARVRLIPIQPKPAPPPPPFAPQPSAEIRAEMMPEPTGPFAKEQVATETGERPVEAPPAAEPVQPAPEAEPNVEQILSEASELLQGLLDHMGIRAKVRGYQSGERGEQDESALVLNIEGDDLGILIGRRGETLAALQYLVRLMVNRRQRRWMNIVVDVEEYKTRRDAHLRQFAVRMAERVVQTGKPVALEAMPARERRIIHLTLRDHPKVTTQSTGEGEHRKVTIRLR
jgi:spoIIIJ-associated protein